MQRANMSRIGIERPEENFAVDPDQPNVSRRFDFLGHNPYSGRGLGVPYSERSELDPSQ